MDGLMDASIWNALAWALLHFLWQGALVTLVTAIALRLLDGYDARLRYAVATTALGVAALMPVVTLLTLRGQTAAPPMPWAAMPADPSASWLPVVVWAWLGGMTVLGVRNLRAWNTVRRWSRESRALDPELTARFARLCQTLGLRRPVRLVVSPHIDVPMALGWIRPMVLLPVGSLTGLPPAQLDALLAHELAHVRRWDYLVNLLQIAVETALFYHPGVWWISRQIRIERENCCDDIAVAHCGDARLYLEALTGMETVRAQTPSFSLSLQGGSLMDRVRRLLSPSSDRRSPASLIAVGLLLMSLLVGVYACDGPTTTETNATLEAKDGANEFTEGGDVTIRFETKDSGLQEFEGNATLREDGQWEVRTADGKTVVWESADGGFTGSGKLHFVHDIHGDAMDDMEAAADDLVEAGHVTRDEIDALHQMHTDPAAEVGLDEVRANQILKMIHHQMQKNAAEGEDHQFGEH